MNRPIPISEQALDAELRSKVLRRCAKAVAKERFDKTHTHDSICVLTRLNRLPAFIFVWSELLHEPVQLGGIVDQATLKLAGFDESDCSPNHVPVL